MQYQIGESTFLQTKYGKWQWKFDELAIHFDATNCKGTLPLSMFLVINDNPYGLMFSLCLYE
jgi:hypothetical protein